MPDQPKERETWKARNKRSAELQSQGYSKKHSDDAAKREIKTPGEIARAEREKNKRSLPEM